ncbi:MAG: hypothetical protein ACFCUO_06860 [Rhodospirillales bacterium]
MKTMTGTGFGSAIDTDAGATIARYAMTGTIYALGTMVVAAFALLVGGLLVV